MRRFAIAAATVLMVAGSVGIIAQGRPTTVEVYKSPTCGCCSKWVDHLRSHGFEVRTTNTDTVDQLKTKHGVPRQVRSCHTALVGGYVVEGHVPATDVQRLLRDRPAIVGIGVPGMPIGSPGMEVASVKAQPFDVIGFAKDGSTRGSHHTDGETPCPATEESPNSASNTVGVPSARDRRAAAIRRGTP